MGDVARCRALPPEPEVPCLIPQTDVHRTGHRLFVHTLEAKGLFDLLQLVTAVALQFGVADRPPDLIRPFAQVEVSQDPSDFLAARMLRLAGTVQATGLSFYTLSFVAHGLSHLGVVAALLLGSGLAYPAAVAVLAVFVVCQMAACCWC